MEYTVEIDNDNKAVIAVIEGRLDLASAKSMTRDVRKKSFELGYAVIYDATNVSLGVGITDAYNFPRDIESIYEDPRHRIGKAAIVYKSDKKFWEFYGTTAKNAGINVSVFTRMQDAMEWIYNGQDS